MDITLLQHNTPRGPFTRAQVEEKLRGGEISPETFAFIPGLARWTPLREVLAGLDAAAYAYAVTMLPPAGPAYAGFWIRVAAHLLDNLIVSIPVFAVGMVCIIAFFGGFGVLVVQMQNSPHDPAAGAGLIGMVAAFYLSLIMLNVARLFAIWLYHAILESGPHQATFGKRVVGLKVTDMRGERITFGRASARYFSTLITGMTLGVGYLMVAFTDHKQTLHDMIAGTLVLQRGGRA